MKTLISQPALMLGAGAALFAIAAGITTVMLNSPLVKPSHTGKSSKDCQTITTDPNPPLKVRSSPVVAPDNVVGQLKNGTSLTVLDENEGWLRISQPVQGWVYKKLTVTSCVPLSGASVINLPSGSVSNVTMATDSGFKTLAQATEQYHLGKLEGAIALARTISSNSAAFHLAQRAISQWPTDWKTAEAKFYSAQKAGRDNRWQDVLNIVDQFPDNRYWREKLTPLVKGAMKRIEKPS
jgi:hypothetical protein